MTTRPDLIFGVNNRHPASIGSGTNSLGTVAYEEQATGSNGWGQRLGVRHYENLPQDAFKAGSDELTKFNGGRVVVLSISGTPGMNETDANWNGLFDRLFTLGFGATDTSGAGTKKPLFMPVCVFHEVDVPSHNVAAATYVTRFKHIKTLRDARAVANGVNVSRVPLMTIFTAYGINIGRAAPYWPGNDQVDIFGVDGYSGLGGGPWVEPANVFGGSLAFSAARGDKDVFICETSVIAATGHDVGVWWSNYAALVAAKPKIKAVLAFQGKPGDGVNFDKVSNPLKHAGMASFLTTTGATAGYGSSVAPPTQLPPSGPTGTAFTSAADGKSITITWSANPTGDNITGWDVFLAPGNVTTGFKGQNPTTLPPTPRSFVVSGLTPGASYTVTAVAINSAGRSGFGSMYSAITTLPGPTNQSPSITSASVTVDTTDTSLVTFAATGTDPNNDTLSYIWTITGPNAFTDAKSGASATGNYDPGNYSVQLTVSDGLLSTEKTLSFSIVAGPTSTPGSNYEIPQPGISLPEITRIYRNTIPDIDLRLIDVENKRSPQNAIHNFVASTFEPIHASATAKTAFAGGDFRWYPMMLQSDTITGICTYVTDVQVGTGSAFCIHDAQGVQLCAVQSGTTVDTPLQSIGDTSIPLDQPITGLSGSVVYVGYLVGSGVTTPFKTYLSVAQGVMGQIRLPQGYWRGNNFASQTAYPDVLPFASATNVTSAFFALY